MRARKVKGIDTQAPLGDMAARIIETRLDELHSFVPQALDQSEGAALHDMRIAAKRLRYVLELTAPCFGPYAAKAARRARELQELIGNVHDCDVMLERISVHLTALREADATALAEHYRQRGEADPSALAHAPARNLYRGLELLAVHYQARRACAFDAFRARWKQLQREQMRKRLRRALQERGQGRDTLSEDLMGAAST